MRHHSRHGQARASDGSYNRETPLSELCQLQAAAIASKIVVSTPPVAVYTSPFPRAVDTAAPLCEKLGLKLQVEERLAEFEMADASLESVQQRPDLIIWRPEHRGAANGETLAEFSARVADCCDEIVQKHLGARVAVVAHSGTIDAVLRWSVGLASASPWQHEFDLANGSITELEFWPQGRASGGSPRYAVLRCVGDVAHLGDLISDL